MNWEQIEKDCPKAFDMANKCGFLSNTTEEMRSLYNFFDENRIAIGIQSGVENIAGMFVDGGIDVFSFKSTIQFYNGKYLDFWQSSIGVRHTREEAEQLAFETAFEILENKL